MSVVSIDSSPICDKSKYIAALGLGYENFNYKELAISDTEDSITLTDLDNEPVTARAVTFYSTVACRIGLNRSVSDYGTEPQLPTETFFSVSCQVTKIYAKASQAGILRIYYVW